MCFFELLKRAQKYKNKLKHKTYGPAEDTKNQLEKYYPLDKVATSLTRSATNVADNTFEDKEKTLEIDCHHL